MKPRIDGTRFGSITVRGTVFRHDVIIRPDGQVKKRKKKLSKAVYGTSHMISRQEAKYAYKQAAGVRRLIVGSGQDGNVELSPKAAAYLKRRKCRVVLLPTPKVINVWNRTNGTAVGLFHVTC
ncbi:MTH938/NDUFAF3 family protein [Dactylosporangium cerinum]|uniref:MTH938/NDUFAF3 family protein n=1 Tax=Dactylosporangium cerinum TaxID=1434730 RepID=A0ABV9W2M5_9ACTN